MRFVLTDEPTPREREHARVYRTGEYAHLEPPGWIIQNDSSKTLFVIPLADHDEG